ncbi:Spy/CpxP family protein refolding chaperone [Cellvibrio fontiphilus]|jgi:Spy/CpxP family protein refolding chaperone|uniref:Spy/CpxP family protein refolding chaperone n=1 Tax=Cellvibrio fontiphilus TaxID=1815559 RepID=A0ABV7FCW2_9GAMM
MNTIKFMAAGALLVGAATLAATGIAAETGKTCDGARAAHHMSKGGHHGGKYAGHLGRLERKLDLSETQKATLKSQREANRSARETLHEQLVKARTALDTAVETGANEAELTALADALGRLQAQQALAGAKNHQAFLAVLTEEQKQTLAELKSKRMERNGARKSEASLSSDSKSS